MEKQKFYLVAADALPEVFLRVAEAKRMLQVGEAATVGDAARQVGISRSAFYKYKDAVQPFQNMHAGHIITFYALLKDNPGVLSNYLSIFANSGANILTINQTIPTNGCAEEFHRPRRLCFALPPTHRGADRTVFRRRRRAQKPHAQRLRRGGGRAQI